VDTPRVRRRLLVQSARAICVACHVTHGVIPPRNCKPCRVLPVSYCASAPKAEVINANRLAGTILPGSIHYGCATAGILLPSFRGSKHVLQMMRLARELPPFRSWNRVGPPFHRSHRHFVRYHVFRGATALSADWHGHEAWPNVARRSDPTHHRVGVGEFVELLHDFSVVELGPPNQMIALPLNNWMFPQ